MRRRSLPGEPEPPTKGELKRRAQAVQEVADRLVDAPQSTLDAIELPETVHDAVVAARRISSRSALLRQRQFVAKLLRRHDVEPIRQALDVADAAGRREARRFRELERWRDRIVADGDGAIEALLAEHPAADREALRALAATCRREPDPGRQRTARRALFRALDAILPGA